MRLFPTPRYHNVPEFLDDPTNFTPHDLESTLRDVRRANIFGLGTWVIKHHLARLLRDFPKGQALRVLDLATGSADIPEELCRWAEREGYGIKIVATDVSEAILNVARERIKRAGFADKVLFAVCDAAKPPFAGGEFDLVICSLALHHLSLEEAEASLRQMARLSRLGFIVNDIYRARGAWYMAWLLAHLTTTSRLTRHDGPASVLRAYTPAEVRRMSRRVGLDTSVYKHPFWRMAVVGKAER
ncbi:MAG: methyltransferase domain-containing protein [Chloroflexi bacterium]|nr:methyltransferase domain-containing protein [Chloroflexota bacterium]